MPPKAGQNLGPDAPAASGACVEDESLFYTPLTPPEAPGDWPALPMEYEWPLYLPESYKHLQDIRLPAEVLGLHDAAIPPAVALPVAAPVGVVSTGAPTPPIAVPRAVLPSAFTACAGATDLTTSETDGGNCNGNRAFVDTKFLPSIGLPKHIAKVVAGWKRAAAAASEDGTPLQDYLSILAGHAAVSNSGGGGPGSGTPPPSKTGNTAVHAGGGPASTTAWHASACSSTTTIGREKEATNAEAIAQSGTTTTSGGPPAGSKTKTTAPAGTGKGAALVAPKSGASARTRCTVESVEAKADDAFLTSNVCWSLRRKPVTVSGGFGTAGSAAPYPAAGGPASAAPGNAAPPPAGKKTTSAYSSRNTASGSGAGGAGRGASDNATTGVAAASQQGIHERSGKGVGGAAAGLPSLPKLACATETGEGASLEAALKSLCSDTLLAQYDEEVLEPLRSDRRARNPCITSGRVNGGSPEDIDRGQQAPSGGSNSSNGQNSNRSCEPFGSNTANTSSGAQTSSTGPQMLQQPPSLSSESANVSCRKSTTVNSTNGIPCENREDASSLWSRVSPSNSSSPFRRPSSAVVVEISAFLSREVRLLPVGNDEAHTWALCLKSVYEIIAEHAVFIPKGLFLWELIYPQSEAGWPVYSPTGIYYVNLFLSATWRLVEIDDFIPCDSSGRPLCPRSCNSAEIWPMLLAKALYKSFQGEAAAAAAADIDSEAGERGEPAEAAAKYRLRFLEALTGRKEIAFPLTPAAIKYFTGKGMWASVLLHPAAVEDTFDEQCSSGRRRSEALAVACPPAKRGAGAGAAAAAAAAFESTATGVASRIATTTTDATAPVARRYTAPIAAEDGMLPAGRVNDTGSMLTGRDKDASPPSEQRRASKGAEYTTQQSWTAAAVRMIASGQDECATEKEKPHFTCLQEVASRCSSAAPASDAEATGENGAGCPVATSSLGRSSAAETQAKRIIAAAKQNVLRGPFNKGSTTAAAAACREGVTFLICGIEEQHGASCRLSSLRVCIKCKNMRPREPPWLQQQQQRQQVFQEEPKHESSLSSSSHSGCNTSSTETGQRNRSSACGGGLANAFSALKAAGHCCWPELEDIDSIGGSEDYSGLFGVYSTKHPANMKEIMKTHAAAELQRKQQEINRDAAGRVLLCRPCRKLLHYIQRDAMPQGVPLSARTSSMNKEGGSVNAAAVNNISSMMSSTAVLGVDNNTSGGGSQNNSSGEQQQQQHQRPGSAVTHKMPVHVFGEGMAVAADSLSGGEGVSAFMTHASAATDEKYAADAASSDCKPKTLSGALLQEALQRHQLPWVSRSSTVTVPTEGVAYTGGWWIRYKDLLQICTQARLFVYAPASCFGFISTKDFFTYEQQTLPSHFPRRAAVLLIDVRLSHPNNINESNGNSNKGIENTSTGVSSTRSDNYSGTNNTSSSGGGSNVSTSACNGRTGEGKNRRASTVCGKPVSTNSSSGGGSSVSLRSKGAGGVPDSQLQQKLIHESVQQALPNVQQVMQQPSPPLVQQQNHENTCTSGNGAGRCEPTTTLSIKKGNYHRSSTCPLQPVQRTLLLLEFDPQPPIILEPPPAAEATAALPFSLPPEGGSSDAPSAEFSVAPGAATLQALAKAEVAAGASQPGGSLPLSQKQQHLSQADSHQRQQQQRLSSVRQQEEATLNGHLQQENSSERQRMLPLDFQQATPAQQAQLNEQQHMPLCGEAKEQAPTVCMKQHPLLRGGAYHPRSCCTLQNASTFFEEWQNLTTQVRHMLHPETTATPGFLAATAARLTDLQGATLNGAADGPLCYEAAAVTAQLLSVGGTDNRSSAVSEGCQQVPFTERRRRDRKKQSTSCSALPVKEDAPVRQQEPQQHQPSLSQEEPQHVAEMRLPLQECVCLEQSFHAYTDDLQEDSLACLLQVSTGPEQVLFDGAYVATTNLWLCSGMYAYIVWLDSVSDTGALRVYWLKHNNAAAVTAEAAAGRSSDVQSSWGSTAAGTVSAVGNTSVGGSALSVPGAPTGANAAAAAERKKKAAGGTAAEQLSSKQMAAASSDSQSERKAGGEKYQLIQLMSVEQFLQQHLSLSVKEVEILVPEKTFSSGYSLWFKAEVEVTFPLYSIGSNISFASPVAAQSTLSPTAIVIRNGEGAASGASPVGVAVAAPEACLQSCSASTAAALAAGPDAAASAAQESVSRSSMAPLSVEGGTSSQLQTSEAATEAQPQLHRPQLQQSHQAPVLYLTVNMPHAGLLPYLRFSIASLDTFEDLQQQMTLFSKTGEDLGSAAVDVYAHDPSATAIKTSAGVSFAATSSPLLSARSARSAGTSALAEVAATAGVKETNRRTEPSGTVNVSSSASGGGMQGLVLAEDTKQLPLAPLIKIDLRDVPVRGSRRLTAAAKAVGGGKKWKERAISAMWTAAAGEKDLLKKKYVAGGSAVAWAECDAAQTEESRSETVAAAMAVTPVATATPAVSGAGCVVPASDFNRSVQGPAAAACEETAAPRIGKRRYLLLLDASIPQPTPAVAFSLGVAAGGALAVTPLQQYRMESESIGLRRSYGEDNASPSPTIRSQSKPESHEKAERQDRGDKHEESTSENAQTATPASPLRMTLLPTTYRASWKGKTHTNALNVVFRECLVVGGGASSAFVTLNLELEGLEPIYLHCTLMKLLRPTQGKTEDATGGDSSAAHAGVAGTEGAQFKAKQFPTSAPEPPQTTRPAAPGRRQSVSLRSRTSAGGMPGGAGAPAGGGSAGAADSTHRRPSVGLTAGAVQLDKAERDSFAGTAAKSTGAPGGGMDAPATASSSSTCFSADIEPGGAAHNRRPTPATEELVDEWCGYNSIWIPHVELAAGALYALQVVALGVASASPRNHKERTAARSQDKDRGLTAHITDDQPQHLSAATERAASQRGSSASLLYPEEDPANTRGSASSPLTSSHSVTAAFAGAPRAVSSATAAGDCGATPGAVTALAAVADAWTPNTEVQHTCQPSEDGALQGREDGTLPQTSACTFVAEVTAPSERGGPAGAAAAVAKKEGEERHAATTPRARKSLAELEYGPTATEVKLAASIDLSKGSWRLDAAASEGELLLLRDVSQQEFERQLLAFWSGKDPTRRERGGKSRSAFLQQQNLLPRVPPEYLHSTPSKPQEAAETPEALSSLSCFKQMLLWKGEINETELGSLLVKNTNSISQQANQEGNIDSEGSPMPPAPGAAVVPPPLMRPGAGLRASYAAMTSTATAASVGGPPFSPVGAAACSEALPSSQSFTAAFPTTSIGTAGGAGPVLMRPSSPSFRSSAPCVGVSPAPALSATAEALCKTSFPSTGALQLEFEKDEASGQAAPTQSSGAERVFVAAGFAVGTSTTLSPTEEALCPGIGVGGEESSETAQDDGEALISAEAFARCELLQQRLEVSEKQLRDFFTQEFDLMSAGHVQRSAFLSILENAVVRGGNGKDTEEVSAATGGRGNKNKNADKRGARSAAGGAGATASTAVERDRRAAGTVAATQQQQRGGVGCKSPVGAAGALREEQQRREQSLGNDGRETTASSNWLQAQGCLQRPLTKACHRNEKLATFVETLRASYDNRVATATSVFRQQLPDAESMRLQRAAYTRETASFTQKQDTAVAAASRNVDKIKRELEAWAAGVTAATAGSGSGNSSTLHCSAGIAAGSLINTSSSASLGGTGGRGGNEVESPADQRIAAGGSGAARADDASGKRETEQAPRGSEAYYACKTADLGLQRDALRALQKRRRDVFYKAQECLQEENQRDLKKEDLLPILEEAQAASLQMLNPAVAEKLKNQYAALDAFRRAQEIMEKDTQNVKKEAEINRKASKRKTDKEVAESGPEKKDSTITEKDMQDLIALNITLQQLFSQGPSVRPIYSQKNLAFLEALREYIATRTRPTQ